MNTLVRRNQQLRLFVSAGVLAATAQMASNATAHPVVFADGTAIMGHHQGRMSGFEIVYSPNWFTGVGLMAERTPEHTSLWGRASLLGWRGNFPDLQTNAYLSLALGQKWNSDANQGTANLGQWNAEWDAEDREYYARAMYSQIFEEKQKRKDKTLIRLGYAPYKASANEAAIWGMLEWKSNSTDRYQSSQHEVTPLIRYFYKNALFEVGSSLSGKFTFNYMFHFF